jgi:nitrate/TMAO reductase-like tetraheme cytochrome c subunit
MSAKRKAWWLLQALVLSPIVIGWIAWDSLREFTELLRTEWYHLVDEWESL